MKIGKLELELIEPVEVEEKLRHLLGLTVAEVRELLGHAAIADHIGAALMPFVKEPPARIELASAIAEGGVVEVRAEVRKLYDKLLGIKAAPAAKEPRGKSSGNRKA